jgi:hypothetical protein
LDCWESGYFLSGTVGFGVGVSNTTQQNPTRLIFSLLYYLLIINYLSILRLLGSVGLQMEGFLNYTHFLLPYRPIGWLPSFLITDLILIALLHIVSGTSGPLVYRRSRYQVNSDLIIVEQKSTGVAIPYPDGILIPGVSVVHPQLVS